MKVNSNNKDISFGGIYNSKPLKKGLEFAADNGSLFAATTTLALSLVTRSAAIFATPKTDKENKKLAFAKSLTSTFIGYLLMLGLSMPLAKSMKNIDKKLTPEAINNLRDGAETLSKSKSYILATQLFKLGLGFVAAIPKAILTAASLPIVMNNICPNENKGLSFKGGISDKIAKVMNNKKYQEFAKKYKDTNFPMHIIAATDTLTTGTFIYQTTNSNKIKDKQKKTLCNYAAISTCLSIITGYITNKITDKPMEKFIEQYKKINKNDSNLDKQLEGIKIAKPILLIGGIYYIIIPIISTFLADKIKK